LDRHVEVPVDLADLGVELVRRRDLGFVDRVEDTNRGAEMQIGGGKEREVAGEVDAAAAQLDRIGMESAELVGEDRLEAAGAGREVARQPSVPGSPGISAAFPGMGCGRT